ncbi:MAG: hypothetical protein ABFD06_00210, partial [Smithella sp.]
MKAVRSFKKDSNCINYHFLDHNARLSRACYRLPLQPIVPERESAREGIIALGSAGRSRSAQRF